MAFGFTVVTDAWCAVPGVPDASVSLSSTFRWMSDAFSLSENRDAPGG